MNADAPASPAAAAPARPPAEPAVSAATAPPSQDPVPVFNPPPGLHLYTGAAIALLMTGFGGLILCAHPARKWAAVGVMFAACALLFAAAGSGFSAETASAGSGYALLCLLAAAAAAVCGPALSTRMRRRCGAVLEDEVSDLRAETAKEEARLDVYK